MNNCFGWLKIDFPWNFPGKYDNYVLWTRLQIVNRGTFELLDKEVFPCPRYYEIERVDALIEYIENHDYVGYVGPKTEARISELEPMKTYHPNNEAYIARNGQVVTREEGWEAIKWIGRHLHAYLKETFPKKEIVWHRSPTHMK